MLGVTDINVKSKMFNLGLRSDALERNQKGLPLIRQALCIRVSQYWVRDYPLNKRF